MLVKVVIAKDIAQGSLFHTALESDEMVESLVAFGQFRPFAGREEGVEFLPYQYRVFHLALGIARVNVASLDAHGR